MSLANFKRNSKLLSVLSLLLIYGFVSFNLGKEFPKIANFLKSNLQEKEKITGNLIDRPQPYADSQSGSVISSYVKLCSNTQTRFEISYPRDWFTTYDSEQEKCTYFAPFSFVVNANGQNNSIPVRVEIVKIEDWLNTVKFYENPNDFQNVESTQNLQIADISVKKIKSLSTGQGSIPRGFVKLSYLVFDANSPLVVYYQQHEIGENISQYETVIEEMVASLRFF